MIEYTNQVMHNAIAHHLLDTAQSVPRHQPLPSGQLPLVLLFSMMPYGVEYAFGQFGSAVLAVSPPSFLCPPQPPRWQRSMISCKVLNLVQALLNGNN